MTVRLRCRTCDWSALYRHGHRTVVPLMSSAMSGAARHECANVPVVEVVPCWWARMWGAEPTPVLTTPATPTEVAAGSEFTASEFIDEHGNRVRWAAVRVVAAHHAETTRRACAVMADLVRAGYQFGPPPCGYRALRIRVTAPGGHSTLRAVLTPDWVTAAVVPQIFCWRAAERLGFAEIARRLNTDRRRYPSPTPDGRWTASGVRRIVTNPTYAGRQVWARPTNGHPVPVGQWITSAPTAHEPLVDDRTFHRAQPHSSGDASGGDRGA